MACTHSAAMAVLNRLGGAAWERTVAAMASTAARFAYPSLSLSRLRSAFAANKPFASKILMASERDG